MADSINLFIAQLDKRVDDAMLRKEFEKFGYIRCAEVTKDEMGNSLGFGFVHFHSIDDGLKAKNEMNGKILFSRNIIVKIANKQISKSNEKYAVDTRKTKANILKELEDFSLDVKEIEHNIQPELVNGSNMNSSDKLEAYKVEIRSMLISYQKGCYLSEFIKDHKQMIGTGLPTKEFGYQTDIEFLQSMPDVVRISQSRYGDYLLQGIADKKSEHIQKMVHKQKPAKLKPPIKSYKSHTSSYAIPPIKCSKSFTNSYATSAIKSSSPTFYANLPIKSSKSYINSYDVPPRFNQNFPQILKYLTSDKPSSATNLSSVTNLTPKEEIVSLVKSSDHGIVLSNLLFEYKKVYNKSFKLSEYGFSSLQECIESVSELDLVNQNDESYVIYQPNFSKLSLNNGVEDNTTCNSNNYLQNNVDNIDIKSAAPKPNMNNYRSDSNSNISQSIIDKLQKVAKKYPDGIRSINFPTCFEEVTKCSFDMHSFGYNRLTDFLDEVPDIFVRKYEKGNKADYIIYPVDSLNLKINGSMDNSSIPKVGPTEIDNIIMNIRNILVAYSEGILLKNLLYVYSINCHDSLNINDLGFDDLETFLNNIKERVPLKIMNFNGEKSVYICNLSDEIEVPYTSSQVCEQVTIPVDAELPEFQFKQFSFSSNFDFSIFYEVYVSAVVNPSDLYIQFERETIIKTFIKLSNDIDVFYNGNESKLYTMKNVHIKPGASCVAVWPKDDHWYRVKILRIVDAQTVRVFHIDYGSSADVPKRLLRYIKKEYAKFPSLAVKCCLSYVKPPNNAVTWDTRASNHLLNLIKDIPLMAKFEKTEDSDVFSVVLCDTNGTKDVFINDLLLKEGFADHCAKEEFTKSVPSSSESVNLNLQPVQTVECHSLTPLQALHARLFLQSFVSVVPSFIHNKHYIALLQEISMHCPNIDTAQTTSNLFSNGLIPMANQALTNNIMLSNTSASNLPTQQIHVPTDHLSTEKDYMIASQSLASKFSQIDLYGTSMSTGCPAVEDEDRNSEIFEEDDDDAFQELCQKIATRKRFVKQIILGDGYKLHIILVQSEPYASSGDISKLIWNNTEAEYLCDRLQKIGQVIPTMNVSEDDNEELFIQLEKYDVKGIQKTTGFKSSILLYPLEKVIQILNIFGHPSLSLKKKLKEEISNFNPNDLIWQEFPIAEIPECDTEENLIHQTDDDKIERLCVVDLHVMNENIKRKRMIMVRSLNSCESKELADKISKLEAMQLKIHRRIEEINKTCDA